MYLHVDLGHTANQQLKLTLIKDINEILRDELAEAGHERLKLLLHTAGDTVLDNAVDVILLVILGDWNITTTGLKFDSDHLAETFFSGGKRLVDDISDIVLTTHTKWSVARVRV